MTEARRVVAALDNSEAALGVARAAAAFGSLITVPVQAVHVREDGDQTAAAAAARTGLVLETIDPVDDSVVSTLTRCADETTVIVLGSVDRPRTGEPLGHVARDLMTRLASPLVVVPPGGSVVEGATTLLIPMDGTETSERTLRQALHVLGDAHCSLTAVHVLDDARLPLFGDQVHYEAEAWRREFRDRHCVGRTPVHLEIRVGAPGEQVLHVADEQHAALVVVGWSRHLDHGRARILRELLARSPRPLLLLPVDSEPAVQRLDGVR